MKLINIWYTQFDIFYRPRSKQTNWVLFYLICFSVINSPTEGIIPSSNRQIKKRRKKSIRYITQHRRLARLLWSIRVIMGLVISFLGSEWKRRPFFFLFAPCGFPSRIRCRHTETGRQTQRPSDTVRLHLLQRAPVTSCLPFFLWNFWVAWCIWHVCDSAGCVRLGLRHHAHYPSCTFFFLCVCISAEASHTRGVRKLLCLCTQQWFARFD